MYSPLAFLILAIALASGTTMAAETVKNTGGAIGAGGDFAYQTGTRGALINRTATDDLYSTALKYEEQAWSSFPPNIKLLAKSFQMGRDANKTDEQSVEFSRAALKAMNSGVQSGTLDAKKYDLLDAKQLKNWATVQNPNVAVAKERFSRYEKYGIKLGKDNTLTTPAGDLNLKGDISSGTLMKIASALGYDPADVAAGLKEAEEERNRILQSATAKADQDLAKKGLDPAASLAANGPGDKDREIASNTAAVNGEAGAQAGLAGAAAPNPALNGTALDGTSGTDPASVEADGPATEMDAYRARGEALAANVEAIRRQMGANSQFADPIGKPGQNIFGMIHDRYQTANRRGRFLEEN